MLHSGFINQCIMELLDEHHIGMDTH